MSDANKAVFLSYASQDAEAAKSICDALRAAGVEVWFDQSELRGGDSWDAKIRKQIKECALFVPVVSTNTQRRHEGYFRLEWHLAEQRSHLIARGRPSIVPVSIDETRDAEALVPDAFLAVQWMKLKGGEADPAFVGQVKKLLSWESDVGRDRPIPPAAREPRDEHGGISRFGKLTAGGPALHRKSFPFLRLALGGLAILVAGFVAYLLFKPRRSPQEIAQILAQAEALGAAESAKAAKAAEQKEAPAHAPEVALPAPPARPEAAAKSVAVLAFKNLSDEKGNEYFSDGISEELLNVLAKIPGLKVAARTSAFYFKDKDTPIPEIARQLGVAYVVEGSVRKAGNHVRITAQLISATDGFHVWSDNFDRDLKDIFAVQDEIAGLIAKNLELKMGMVAARPTVDLEAYQEYLTGRALFAKAGNGDLQEAVGHFEKAIALEPKFTAAWVQLASAHTQLGRWGGAPTLQAWAAARIAIDHAIALEPDSPDVLLALGWIRRTADWDWRGAEQAFRRALQLRPNHPDTLAGAAVLLYNIGQDDEAFRLGQQAVKLDPLNASTQLDLSLMYYLSNNFAEGERAARRALALAPGGAGYHSVLAWSLIGQKRYAEAEAEARLDTDEIQQAVGLALVAMARGQTEAARAQMARLEKLTRPDGDRADLQNNIAWIAAALGEKDRAFAALQKAQAFRDPSVSWWRNGLYLQLLFADPRWSALLHQVGLADEQLKGN